jgi:hypothetical protein
MVTNEGAAETRARMIANAKIAQRRAIALYTRKIRPDNL